MTMKIHLFAAAALLASTSALSQQPSLELPRPSPSAKFSQTVGLTEISIEYSSPGVHGRTIWGNVLPWGQLWRAGANSATKITFSKDVTVGTTPVSAGSYAFFVIPNQQGPWTAIFNKDFNQGGTASYKQELDVLRLDVKPDQIPLRERLAYQVTDFNNDAAALTMEWEKVRLSIPIKLGTDAQVAANLKNMEDNAWSPYNAAANYELNVKKDYDTGLAYAEKSIKIHETWQNVWTKAQLIAAKGKYKDAISLIQKAQKLGDKAPPFFAEESGKQIADWKKKL
jgi:hypothetical protein